jgi:hypothetical protein
VCPLLWWWKEKLLTMVWVAEWQQQLGLHSLVTNCPYC